MKKTTIILVTILTLALLFPMFSDSNPIGSKAYAAESKTVEILFTNDIHSHLEAIDDKGGMPKLKAAMKQAVNPQEKKEEKRSSGKYYSDDPNGTGVNSSSGTSYSNSSSSSSTKTKDYEKETFVLDAGNFSMGTPFQTIFGSSASELRMLGELGYDVVGLGQNEFAYGEKMLSKMFRTAAGYKETTRKTETRYNREIYAMETVTTFEKTMPEVVCSNMDWKTTLNNSEHKKEAKKLRSAWSRYDVQDYTVVKKNGVKMAVFGLMGTAAGKDTASAGATWKDPVKRAEEVVAEIKRNDKVDLIVCLSSGGIKDVDGEDGEDIELAEKVDDIDLIISSNSNKATAEPIVREDTIIVSTDGDTAQLGHLKLKKKKGGYKVKDYDLISLNSKITGDADTSTTVAEFKNKVNSDYLEKYGFTYDEKITKNKKGVRSTGNMLADSMKKAVKETDVAVVSQDSIDADIEEGKLTTSDIFKVCGEGIGVDGTPGRALAVVYLTGKELKKLPEISVSYGPKNKSAKLYFSGLSYSYNMNRFKLNKAFDIALTDQDGNKVKIQNGRLYKVTTGLTELDNLRLLGDRAAGMMKIEPKDEDGKPIKDFDKAVAKKKGKERKSWQALAKYMKKFKGGKVPAEYAESDGRVLDKTGINPINLVKNPNNMGVIIWAVILIIVAIVVGIVFYFRQRKFDRRGFSRRVFKSRNNRNRRMIFKSSIKRSGKHFRR